VTAKQYIFDDLIHVITFDDRSQIEIAGFAIAAAEKFLPQTQEFKVRMEVLDELDESLISDSHVLSKHIVFGQPRSSPAKAITEASDQRGVVVVHTNSKFENGDTKFFAAWVPIEYRVSQLLN